MTGWRARAALLVLAALSMAHVGSPDTFFAGKAGPYDVRVSVRLPGVSFPVARRSRSEWWARPGRKTITSPSAPDNGTWASTARRRQNPRRLCPEILSCTPPSSGS